MVEVTAVAENPAARRSHHPVEAADPGKPVAADACVAAERRDCLRIDPGIGPSVGVGLVVVVSLLFVAPEAVVVVVVEVVLPLLRLAFPFPSLAVAAVEDTLVAVLPN